MRVCVRRTVPTPSAVNRGAAHTAPLTSLELCPSALKAASPRGCSRFRVGAGSPPHFTGSPWSAGKSLTTASLEKNCPGLDTAHLQSLQIARPANSSYRCGVTECGFGRRWAHSDLWGLMGHPVCPPAAWSRGCRSPPPNPKPLKCLF